MTGIIASGLVVLAGLYLVGLGVASFVLSAHVSRFLLGFAGSAFTHYLELSIRIVVGGAFLVHSQRMLFSGIFSIVGWVLVATSAGLFLVPWHWHRRFAQRSVPYAIRYLPLVGTSSIAVGGFILLATARGAA